MIGIDLVDLHQAQRESNWRRKGYLNKVFSEEEQLLILSHPNPSEMVWLLWTMKEAAYKIWSRETGLICYAPARLICKNICLQPTAATGTVCWQKQCYFTSSSLNEQYICSQAASDKSKLKDMRTTISTPYLPGDTSYKSSGPQSVSHHGRYLALAWL